MIKLGKLQFDFMLAPLAGITSLPFRMLCRKFGCGLAFLEMINARSLCCDSKVTQEMLATNNDDKPLGIQLVSDETECLIKSVEALADYNFDLLDFNAACPRHKVTARGRGAALLKNPKKLRDLLTVLVANSPVPVTAKIRLGWGDSSQSVDISRYVQDSGVSALCVHGRTKIQGYSGRVDYAAIAKIKKALSIPVIASGDIFDAPLAKKMFDETGCDAIAVARGALGNPWIFREIRQYLKDGSLPGRPSPQELAETMREHLDAMIEYEGQQAVLKFRKFYIWYTRGFRDSRSLRRRANNAFTRDDMLELIEELSLSQLVA